MSSYSDAHDGQKPLREVESALEADAILHQRPKGMPPLSAIKTELARLGFPESDAADIYDRWLASGFRSKQGPIRDWRAALRTRAREGWLLSQKQARVVRPGGFQPPSEDEVLAYAKLKRWTTSYGKWCYQHFVANDWKHYKDPITSTAQWQALMATELQNKAPR